MRLSSRRLLVSGAIAVAGSQLAVQALGFASSILVIRTISLEEYALYTLGVSLLGVLSAISDSGVAGNAMAQSGRVWDQAKRLGGILTSANALRRQFAVVTLLACFPIVFLLLRAKFDDPIECFLVLTSVACVFFANLPTAVLEVPLKLHQDLKYLIGTRLWAAVARFGGVLMILWFSTSAWMLILSAALIQPIVNRSLLKRGRAFADYSSPIDRDATSELKAAIWKTLPTTLYFGFSSQLSLWALAYFGVIQSVAEVGALGRLAAIAAVLSVAFETVVVPRFAKLDSSTVRRRFCILIAWSAVVLSVLSFSCNLFLSEILTLLGKNYINLATEARLLVISTTISLLASFVWALSTSRAFIPRWFVYPALGVLAYCAAALLIGLKTTHSVLLVGVVLSVVSLVVNIAVFWIMSRPSFDCVRNY